MIRPLISEQLLIDTEPPVDFCQALVASPGRAQVAMHLANRYPQATVTAWFMDLFQSNLVQETWQQQARTVPAPPVPLRLPEIRCQADLPVVDCQLVMLPVLKNSPAELTRELIQQAYLRLDEGGTLIVAVDNPKDKWLYEQMQAVFPKVRNDRRDQGCVYWGRKQGDLKRERDFSCQFVFRDRDRLIQAISRPGVFSHRRLDPGTRQLLNACEVTADDRVLDIGCGSGCLSLASAFCTEAEVVGIDSNARSIECLIAGAQLNGLNNVRGILNADGKLLETEKFDIALANPPYFGNHQISQHFLRVATDNLVSGGALLVVTQKPEWFELAMQQEFEDLESFPSGNYHVVCGHRI